MTRRQTRAAQRVGVFGIFGTGNSGNEASLESMLNYLRASHPEAVIDAMSAGFTQLPIKQGIAAIPLKWYEYHENAPGPVRPLLKVLGKAIDPLRIFRWVRAHDSVIVPGMGVLEDTTPVRAYGFPLSLFLLAAAGRVCGVKVALVSVGASIVRNRATRFLLSRCASMATYRSYRDDYSMQAVRQAGVDISGDRVYPDLAFSLPTPPFDPGNQSLVGIGIMDYNGGTNDLARATELHSSYFDKMTTFVRWLLENDYDVRFFGGDDLWDYAIADKITDHIRQQCPDIDVAARITADPFGSYAELLTEMNRVGTMIATRYHNVLGALKLCKPTIAVGYAHKFVPLMESMGLAEFTQFAENFEVGLLIRQFEAIQRRRAELVPEMERRNAAKAEGLAEQFATLSGLLFDGVRPGEVSGAATGRSSTR
jgi:polysaccharide pyruvyl transferase WcaK-like protein